MTDIFISYSRRNTAFVRQLYTALTDEALAVWVDWEGIPPSAEWLKEIHQAIDEVDNIVFVVSAAFCRSAICQQELQYAVKRNKRLIPVVIEDLPGDVVPAALSELNWLFFRETEAFDDAFQILLQAINTDLDWVRAHTRLLNKALEWDHKARDAGLLLRGKELASTQRLISVHQTKEPLLTDLQKHYVDSGRQHAKKRSRSQLLIAAVVSVIIALVSWFGYQQRLGKEREQQAGGIERARVLAGEALQLERDAGIIKAVEAAELLRTVSTEIDPLVHNTLIEKAGSYRFEPRAKPHKKNTRVASFGLPIGSLVFTPDNKLLGSSSREEVVRRWSLCPEQADNVFCGKKPVKDLTISLPQRKVALGFDGLGGKALLADGEYLTIYTLAEKSSVECSQPLTLENIGREITLSIDGQWAAIPYGSRHENLWVGQSGCADETLNTGFSITPVASQKITASAFHPDGKHLYIAQSDGRIYMRNLLDNTEAFVLKNERSIVALAISPDGRWLAINTGGKVRLLDLHSETLTAYPLEGGQMKGALAFDHAGWQLAVYQRGNQQREVRLFNIRDPENIPTPLRFNIPYKQHDEPNVWVKTLAFSHDNQWLAAGLGGDNYDVLLWPLTIDKRVEMACGRLQGETQCSAK